MRLAEGHVAGNKRLGMKLFILSDALTFAALLAGYSYLRMGSVSWPRPFATSNIVNAGGMTLCLLASSVTMMRMVLAARRKDVSARRRWLIATVLGGVAFLVLHANEGRRMIGEGIRPGLQNSDPSIQVFASTFFGITGLHMLHVLSAIVLVIVTALRTRSSTADYEIAGFYWQFVDAVWIFVLLMVYLPSWS